MHIRGEYQQQIRFNHPIDIGYQIGSTTPDVYFAGDPDDEDDKGVCIYLDGMSAHFHGNPKTAEKDKEIRAWLQNHGYEVISINATELDDHNAVVRHFKKLAKYLGDKPMAKRLDEDREWLEAL